MVGNVVSRLHSYREAMHLLPKIATIKPEMLIGVNSSPNTTVPTKMVATSLKIPATDLEDKELR